eukprot:gene6261-biopygen7451
MMTGQCGTLKGFTRLPLSQPYGFDSLKLAHVLDSLVRVSRRGVRGCFVSYQAIDNGVEAEWKRGGGGAEVGRGGQGWGGAAAGGGAEVVIAPRGVPLRLQLREFRMQRPVEVRVVHRPGRVERQAPGVAAQRAAAAARPLYRRRAPAAPAAEAGGGGTPPPRGDKEMIQDICNISGHQIVEIAEIVGIVQTVGSPDRFAGPPDRLPRSSDHEWAQAGDELPWGKQSPGCHCNCLITPHHAAPRPTACDAMRCDAMRQGRGVSVRRGGASRERAVRRRGVPRPPPYPYSEYVCG